MKQNSQAVRATRAPDALSPNTHENSLPAENGADLIFVGLGSNQGDVAQNLAAARNALEKRGFTLAAASSVYLTEPQGYKNQPWFANQVVRLELANTLTPTALLDILLEEETKLGRVRSADPALRFGPRLIDIDLLLFGRTVMNTPRLTLPHPRLAERAFMLVPLLEIAPDLVLPDGQSAAKALHALPFQIEGHVIRQ